MGNTKIGLLSIEKIFVNSAEVDSVSFGNTIVYNKNIPMSINKGDIIAFDAFGDGSSKKFRVLKVENNIATLMSLDNDITSKYTTFAKTPVIIYDDNGNAYYSYYENSILDEALNTTYYNNLSPAVRAAIVTTNVVQSVWAEDRSSSYFDLNNLIIKRVNKCYPVNAFSELDTPLQEYYHRITQNTIGNRYCFALDIDDIIEYFGLADGDTAFGLDILPLLFDQMVNYQNFSDSCIWCASVLQYKGTANMRESGPCIISGATGFISGRDRSDATAVVRPVFKLNLLKTKIKALSSLRISTAPTKTVYEIGDELDLTGLTIIATYSDGSEKIVTNYTASGFDSSVSGETTVIFTYNGYTTSIDLKVRDALEPVPAVVKGDIIAFDAFGDGIQRSFRVIDVDEYNITTLMSLDRSIISMYEKQTASGVPRGQVLMDDGSFYARYINSLPDQAANTTYYNNLSAVVKAAIVPTKRIQSGYDNSSIADYSYDYSSTSNYQNIDIAFKTRSLSGETVHYYKRLGQVIVGKRNCFIVDLDDIQKYFNASADSPIDSADFLELFFGQRTTLNSELNSSYIWCASADYNTTKYSPSSYKISGPTGLLSIDTDNREFAVQPMFRIRLSEINYTKQNTINVFLEALNVTKGPVKDEYFIGESFDPTGLYVYGCYSDGTKTLLNISDLDIDALHEDSTFGTVANSNTTVTISYTTNGITQSAVITVSVATPDPTVTKGSIISFDALGNGVQKKFRVIKLENGIATVLSLDHDNTTIKYNDSEVNGIFNDNKSYIDYNESIVDVTNNNYYNSLSANIKAAIVQTNRIQSCYKSATTGINSPAFKVKKYKGINANRTYSYQRVAQKAIGNRYCFALDLDDIKDYFDADSTTIISGNAFIDMYFDKVDQRNIIITSNNKYIWLASASASGAYSYVVDVNDGFLSANSYKSSSTIRPAFRIKLSEIRYIKDTLVHEPETNDNII